jgi:hypothetical protein
MAREVSADDVLTPTLTERARLERITPKNWLRRVPNARLEIESRAGQLDMLHILVREETVEKTSARIEIGAPAVPMFRWLGERRLPFQAGELTAHFPQIGVGEYRQVFEPLIRAGLLKMLWFTPRKGPAA